MRKNFVIEHQCLIEYGILSKIVCEIDVFFMEQSLLIKISIKMQNADMFHPDYYTVISPSKSFLSALRELRVD